MYGRRVTLPLGVGLRPHPGRISDLHIAAIKPGDLLQAHRQKRGRLKVCRQSTTEEYVRIDRGVVKYIYYIKGECNHTVENPLIVAYAPVPTLPALEQVHVAGNEISKIHFDLKTVHAHRCWRQLY